MELHGENSSQITVVALRCSAWAQPLRYSWAISSLGPTGASSVSWGVGARSPKPDSLLQQCLLWLSLNSAAEQLAECCFPGRISFDLERNLHVMSGQTGLKVPSSSYFHSAFHGVPYIILCSLRSPGCSTSASCPWIPRDYPAAVSSWKNLVLGHPFPWW